MGRTISRSARRLRFEADLADEFSNDALTEIVTYSDSDWAGDSETGRSTSGACIMFARCLFDLVCNTQGSVSLSSAEEELHAVTSATASTIFAGSGSRCFWC